MLSRLLATNLCYFSVPTTRNPLCTCDEMEPLGMEDGRIPDKDITSSSTQNKTDYSGPSQARLNNKIGAWVPANPDDYLQVDFGHVMEIGDIITKGHPTKNMYVKLYYLKYTTDGVNWQVFVNVIIRFDAPMLQTIHVKDN